jgi:hypothetical protein
MGLNILKWNLFQNSAIKQAKYLVSQPNKAQPCIYHAESGTVSLEVLPANNSFVQAPENIKKAWAVMNPLIRHVLKDGQSWKDIDVLPISDYNYLPLDPHNAITEKDKKHMISLGRIAKMSHLKYRQDSSRPQDPNHKLTELIVQWGFVSLGLFAILGLVMKKLGG